MANTNEIRNQTKDHKDILAVDHLDRERREAEAKESSKAEKIAEVDTETPANGGLFANIKGGEDILKKLQDSDAE